MKRPPFCLYKFTCTKNPQTQKRAHYDCARLSRKDAMEKGTMNDER